MIMRKEIFSLALLTVILPQLTECSTKIDYYNLFDILFDKMSYKKEVRPILTETNTTMLVFMAFNLLSIVEVNEKQQTLVTSARLWVSWIDTFLSWEQSYYGGLQTLLVPQKNVYLPDIVLANTVTTQDRLGYDELQVRLYFNGFIEWEPSIISSTACDIDITYFPFDTQVCYINFETAMSRSHEISIFIGVVQEPISLEYYSQNGQWDVLETNATNLVDINGKAKIQFALLLKRRRTFYLLNIILPVFFLSLMSSLVFALPADNGEKMGTGITVLLAFAVYLTIVSELVPNTSLQVSILGLYLTILLGMSALSMIVCVLILRLHFQDEDKPVGHKTFVLTRCLRKMMFLKKMKASKTRIPTNHCEEFDDIEGKQEECPTVKDVQSSSIQISSIKCDTETWKDVAYTLDYFCFIIFSFLTVVITLACLLWLHIGGEINAPSL